jgi:hypothetical protein
MNASCMNVSFMKIYIPTIKLTSINQGLLDKFLIKKTTESYIYSEDGIIQIKGDKLFKLNLIDEVSKRSKLDNFDIITDNSKFIVDCECLQVYPYHVDEIVHKYIYKLRNDAIIDFIIEKNNDTIIDCYFYLKDEKHFMNIKEDILTFLFQLNLC